MIKYTFQRINDESFIIVEACIEGYPVRLALDTAATHTVIDVNILLLLGYSENSKTGTTTIETATGLIEVGQYTVKKFEALQKIEEPFHLLSFDFLSKGIPCAYDGILGLDFFSQTVLTIDFMKQELWLVQEEMGEGFG